jgi:peroxiredoxin
MHFPDCPPGCLSARLTSRLLRVWPCLQSFGIKADLLGLLPGRQTFVIDKNGKCVLSFNDQMNAEQHVAEALAVISKL